MADATWVGVDIGGTKTAVVVSAQPPQILQRIEFPTLPERGPQQTIDRIMESIWGLLRAEDQKPERLAGIGISCGGPLNAVTGIVQAPPNLSTWIDVPIVRILREEFRVPCALENDANAGAVAEHRYGAGKGTRDMVFLTMGTGLGAGIIADGHLIRGADGQAGEIGHVRLTSAGPAGYHKVGSVEGWASGGGVAQVARARVEDAIRAGEPTALSAILQRTGEVTAKDVGEAAHGGDALAVEIVRSTGRRLGEALAILVDILNPERIVIGGLALRLGEMLLAPARAILRQEALPKSALRCEVVPAALGETIGDVASLCIAQDCGSRATHERL